MSDVAGTWNITISTLFGKGEGVLDLKVDGTKVTGSGRTGDHVITLSEGTLEGDQLSLPIKLTSPVAVDATAVVAVRGDSMKGKIVGGPLPGMKVSGTKQG